MIRHDLLHILDHPSDIRDMSSSIRKWIINLGLHISIPFATIKWVRGHTCLVILPLNTTSPVPFPPSLSDFDVVLLFNTNITVEVSLYFADRPRSWHSNTWSESHDPVCSASVGRAVVNIQHRILLTPYWDEDLLFFKRTTPAKASSLPCCSSRSQR
jgi:hypothetical protein